MNAIDARARRASSAIHESLATAAAPATFAAVVRRAAIAKAINVALIGAGAVVFIAAGAAFRTPQPQTPVAETVTTTTSKAPAPATTIPNGEGPLIVTLPTTTEPAPPTTAAPTTTTEAPPTTTTTSKPPPTTTTTKPPPPTTTKPPDTTPPVIEITFPENRQRFTEPVVTIKGTTEPGATVKMGDRKADMGEAGLWRIRVELEPGRNRFVVTASDAAGNSARAAVVVFYDAPDVAPFTAYATYGSCEEDPPYDVYYGRGEPASAITVTSKYGSGSTKVGVDGGWEIKVFFPAAPPGKVFLVNIADEYGRSKVFEFVSNVPA